MAVTRADEEPSMREVLAQHLHTFFSDSLVPWSDVAPDRRDKWLHGADLVMAVTEPYRVHDMDCRARQVLLEARSELYNLELPGDGLVYRSQVSQMLQRVTMRVGTEE